MDIVDIQWGIKRNENSIGNKNRRRKNKEVNFEKNKISSDSNNSLAIKYFNYNDAMLMRIIYSILNPNCIVWYMDDYLGDHNQKIDHLFVLDYLSFNNPRN